MAIILFTTRPVSRYSKLYYVPIPLYCLNVIYKKVVYFRHAIHHIIHFICITINIYIYYFFTIKYKLILGKHIMMIPLYDLKVYNHKLSDWKWRYNCFKAMLVACCFVSVFLKKWHHNKIFLRKFIMQISLL